MEKDEKKMSGIYAKMHAVFSNIDRIEKNGWNDFHKYNYIRHTDIKIVLRELFSENKILPIINQKEVKQDGNHTSISIELKLIDIETCEEFSTLITGESLDNSDKGIAKAMVLGLKYWFIENFFIPAEDEIDPDGKSPERKQKKTIELKIKSRSDSKKQKIGYTVEDIKSAIAYHATKGKHGYEFLVSMLNNYKKAAAEAGESDKTIQAGVDFILSLIKESESEYIKEIGKTLGKFSTVEEVENFVKDFLKTKGGIIDKEFLQVILDTAELYKDAIKNEGEIERGDENETDK